jgi:hypothetical protein
MHELLNDIPLKFMWICVKDIPIKVHFVYCDYYLLKIESVGAVKGRSNLPFAANLMRANISHTRASFIPANLLSTEKCFASGLGSGIVEWLLSKRNDSISLPYTIIVIGGSVEHGTTCSISISFVLQI